MTKATFGVICLVTLFVFGLLLGGCQPQTTPPPAGPGAQPRGVTPPPAEPESLTIMDTAAKTDSLKSLVNAIRAVKMGPTLRGEGPFTVLAPNNAAFKKLPEGTMKDLLKPENAEKLKDLLSCHVVSGKLMSADIAAMTSANALNNKPLTIKAQDGSVMINNAKVVKADIECSNGVVHIIDTVLVSK